ncbi:MAG: ATP-binding protein [Anaerolineae bacterium]|nr:ATP-binding protein [Anaerolineae bacterium]
MKIQRVKLDDNILVSPVIYGRAEVASYSDPLIPGYRHNPLIEALPPILTQEKASLQLSNYPKFDEQQRLLPAELRFHLIQEVLDFFEPLAIHLDLEQRFSRLIRRGYKNRNPQQRRDWADVDHQLKALAQRLHPANPHSGAVSFTLLGISGVGKSTAVERILSLYPQIIFHSHYQQQPLSLTQLVWLKLDCPFDGSTKGLCLNFFEAIDRCLETHYYYHYTRNGRASTDEMLVHMARVGAIHQLGVLVVDEIQNLNEAKSGGDKKMLNFFVQLVNTMGLPVVLIGTHKARRLLAREFRQARRSTGQGRPIWDNMVQDETWHLFVESLWCYQYVHQSVELTPKLSHTLYDESQGITDFVVKLFMLAQIRAIVSGQERLTPNIIRSVAADSLQFAAPALSALRRGDRAALQQFEDIEPLDLEPYLEQARLALQSQQQSGLRSKPVSPKKSKKAQSQENERQVVLAPHDIRDLVGPGEADAHHVLQTAKVTRPAGEYVSETA